MSGGVGRVLVTGGAGFIGSHLSAALLEAGYEVRVFDNFSSGHERNLTDLALDAEIFEGDICDSAALAKAFKGVDYCLHEAAVPSVPRSIESPWKSNRVNVEGSLNVFLAARSAGARRVIFASSSAVYGNVPRRPVREEETQEPISPYGVSKRSIELYAGTFNSLYDMDIAALRYFNVFGPRQDPRSRYAAVIPLFISSFLAGETPYINGDGEQARDFTYVKNVVSANLLALKKPGPIAGVYNIACGISITINNLVEQLREYTEAEAHAEHVPAREGDIRYSCADISNARNVLGYEPLVNIGDGLRETVAWFQRSELV